MTRTTAGSQVVAEIFEELQVDDEWSVWDDAGFRWWPHERSQRVWVEDDIEDHPERVNIETGWVRVPERSGASDVIFSGWGAHASVSAFVHRDDLVCVRTSAFVHPENAEWVSRVLRFAAMVQAAGAADIDEGLIEHVEGEPISSAPPGSAVRTEPDEILDAAYHVPVVPGWDDQNEFDAVAEMLTSAGALSFAGDLALTAEFPIGAIGGPALDGGDSILFEALTDEPHPLLGPGLRMRLRLPRWPTDRRISPVFLNEFEVGDPCGAYLIGSWGVDIHTEPPVYLFTSFLPNVLSRRGLLTNMVLSMGARAAWVSRYLND